MPFAVQKLPSHGVDWAAVIASRSRCILGNGQVSIGEESGGESKTHIVNKFGGSGAFTGTKAPTPGGFGTGPAAVPTPVGAATRSFADSSGKTPAQIWAEKKARERGLSGGASDLQSGYTGAAPVVEQKSGAGAGSGAWESGYTGKKWAAVETTKTGRSSIGEQRTGDADDQQDAPASRWLTSHRSRR